MRSLIVASLLAVAIIACLASTVSAGGYGQGHIQSYARYTPPRYGYRYLRQKFLIHPGSGGYAGGGYAGGGYSYGVGGLARGAFNTGFNLIWLIILIFFALFLINLK